MPPVSIQEVHNARKRLKDVALRTPLVRAYALEKELGSQLWLKAENLQRTGSFKIRGAYNAISSLSPSDRARDVITYSSGNHGQAVACAANLLNIRAVVVMPEDAIPKKVEATRAWGAEVEFAGTTSLSRQERALELAQTHGYAVIPPFDDKRIIAGQGTVGLEIVEGLPEVDAVIVPVGGGGLISGVATAVKALRPTATVIGVEPEGGADARDSLRDGHVVTWQTVDTIADGLRTSRIGDLNFATIRELVDDIATVSDDEILAAVCLLAEEAKLVAEPSGAVATAALLSGKLNLDGKKVVSVISGGNVEPSRLREYIDAEHRAAESISVPAH